MKAAGLQELEKLVKLLATALKLPPGPDRHNALREIGRIRARLTALQGKPKQTDCASTLKLVALTLRQIQALEPDHVDPTSRDREASGSLPAVKHVVAATVSSAADAVKLGDRTSMQRRRAPVVSIEPTEDPSLIAPEILQSAITEAVKDAEPACETFVGVIVQRIKPKSRFAANWALRGVKFGRADREKAYKAVTTVVERMQREFRLSDG